ncbi:hypothetical protein DPMN_162058 [Dreissena polymorpha]|uniref:Uncharacterized protein n=1 Tax=Dreissena polymorpha TaxID=45954 RepID=A0A9D4EPM6_DREPO|nr:hypothetical protein DPMN_162058 [Dreissena polymorpha]
MFFNGPEPRINVATTVLTRQIFMTHNGRQTIDKRLGKNVNCRLLTYFHYIHIEKTAPPPGGHVFPPMLTIFELVRDICKIDANIVTSRKTHFLTKFHEDWTKNVTSSLFTCFHYIHIENTAPPLGDINKTNVLTKFYDDWAKIVTSRVFTRYFYIHIMNTAPLPGGHVFQRTETFLNLFEPTYYLDKHFDKVVFFTYFKLSRCINNTNVLTKFHEYRTINVASRVFTRHTVDGGRRTEGDHES